MNDIPENVEVGHGNYDETDTLHRILCVCFEGKKIGVVSFDELTSVIQVSSTFEVHPTDVDEILLNVKEHCKPSVILLQSKTVTNKSLLDIICRRDNIEDGGVNDIPFKVIKNSFWRYDNAINDMLQHLSVKSYRPDQRRLRSLHELDYQENMLRLSVCLDIENRPIVSAMGALLQYIRAEIFTLDGGDVHVADIQPLLMDNSLRLDSSTFKSLQIFCEDQHPLLFKKKGKSKEGFSLFSLLDRTVSLSGRKRLRGWLSRPYCNREKIVERQDGVEMMSRERNSEFVKELVKLLRHTHDLPRILLRIKKVNASHVDWINLCQTVENALQIVDQIFFYMRQPCSSLDEVITSDKAYLETLMGSANVQVIKNLCETLHIAIDISNTKEQKQVTICAGFDEALDSLRTVYDNLDDELALIAKNILQQAPLLSHVSVEYLPQIGYLIAIQEQDQHFLPVSAGPMKAHFTGFVMSEPECNNYDEMQPDNPQCEVLSSCHDVGRCNDVTSSAVADSEDFQQEFLADSQNRMIPSEYKHIYSSEGMMYFKHPVVYSLDESIGDVHARMLDRQKDILLEVECEVLDCEYHFLQLSVILESLDAIISLGTIAKEMNYVRPELVEEPVVIVKAARHPLQELTVDHFIPNDIFLSPEKHIGIITGLNGSGKSVYLKQVGLLVYLAHVGSFLPCERAVIGLCDRILTRVSSVESASCPMSAFILDLSQLKRMLDLFTRRSLCLIDESLDGMSLVAATIMRFYVTPPCRVLFTTHFLEIFHSNIIDTSHLSSITTFKMDALDEDELTETTALAVQENVKADHDLQQAKVTVCTTALTSALTAEKVPLYKIKIGMASTAGGIACARRAGINQQVLLRAEELQHDFLQNRGGVRPLKNVLNKTNYDGGDEESTCKSTSLQQNLSRQPVGDDDSVLGDFKSEEIKVLQNFFCVDQWQTVTEDVVQALMNNIQELL